MERSSSVINLDGTMWGTKTMRIIRRFTSDVPSVLLETLDSDYSLKYGRICYRKVSDSSNLLRIAERLTNQGIVVVAPPGSGKSHLVSEAEKFDVAAYDGDTFGYRTIPGDKWVLSPEVFRYKLQRAKPNRLHPEYKQPSVVMGLASNINKIVLDPTMPISLLIALIRPISWYQRVYKQRGPREPGFAEATEQDIRKHIEYVLRIVEDYLEKFPSRYAMVALLDDIGSLSSTGR